MKRISIYFFSLLACCLLACLGNDDVDVIEPWEEMEYELPQGKSDADDRIVNYFEKCGSYILYEYPDLDFDFELSESYLYELPDPIYVGDMLDFLEETWFDFYSVEFHKHFMPLKIMLTKYLAYEDPWTEEVILEYFCYYGSEAIAIGYCSDALQEFSPATKLEFKNELHSQLWNNWYKELDIPEDFFAISDYTRVAVTDVESVDYVRNRGFVANYLNDPPREWATSLSYSTGRLDEKTDLKSYLIGMAVRTSADWAEDLKWPLVKQKYDILRDWIQETYGFDLQKVGDATYD